MSAALRIRWPSFAFGSRKTRVFTLSLLAVVAECFVASITCATPQQEIVWTFGSQPGAPVGGLVLAPDGYLWGAAANGGAHGSGTIFKVRPDGSEWRVVLSFSLNELINKGTGPTGNLLVGSDGFLYGTTVAGGGSMGGTIFRVSLAGELTTIAELVGDSTRPFQSPAGYTPNGHLIEASDGNFYGTTAYGGVNNDGAIFRMTPAGVVTTVASLLTRPRAGLVEGIDGFFYGGTDETIFKVSPTGELTTLASGISVTAEFCRGPDGNIYGLGTLIYPDWKPIIFKIDAGGGVTVLHDFGTNTDAFAESPRGGLMLGSDGNFYGFLSAYTGGQSTARVYKISPTGAYSIVATYNAGNYPSLLGCTLLQGPDGTLYGIASGTDDRSGSVFKVSPAGVASTVVQLSGPDSSGEGTRPAGGLTSAGDGTFFGTTTVGGRFGVGTIFNVSPLGTLNTLVEFSGNGASNRGATPIAALIPGIDGSYYGMTNQGGTGNTGTIFKMTPDGALTTLVDFSGNGPTGKGANPIGTLAQDIDGSLFGTTSLGGANNYGTVFKLSSSGNFTTLAEFSGFVAPYIGRYPLAGLLLGSDGNFYGTTSESDIGGVFKVSPAGDVTTFVTFPHTIRDSSAPLVEGSDGNFYGSSAKGGTVSDFGTLYKVSPTGVVSVLFEFPNNSLTYGTAPMAGLIQAPDGNFYGTTSGGALNGSEGTIFQMTPAGAVTKLQGVLGFNQGLQPHYGALVLGADGNLYGTTEYGDVYNGGNVYRLRFGPKAVTLPASVVSTASVTLNGTLTAGDIVSSCVFEYGTSASALSSTTPPRTVQPPNLFNGEPADTPISAQISGLNANTTYYFRLRGNNADQFQPQFGEIRSFTTASGATPTPTPSNSITPTPTPTPVGPTATPTPTPTGPTVTPTPTNTPFPQPTATPTPTPTPTPPEPPIVNLSTRLREDFGANRPIAGFIIGGVGLKHVVIRALGPSLGPLGVPFTVQYPRLSIFNAAGTMIAQNDNWQFMYPPVPPYQTFPIYSTAYAPEFYTEAAIGLILPPGAYTAFADGESNGVTLVEIYDEDFNLASRLENISTRGNVMTGDNVMIAGFIIGGTTPQTVVVRAIGPSLAVFGLSGLLIDPVLTVYDSDRNIIATVDDTSAADAPALGPLLPSDPREAAVKLTLPPGAYTAIVTGKNGTTGIALVEVYLSQ